MPITSYKIIYPLVKHSANSKKKSLSNNKLSQHIQRPLRNTTKAPKMPDLTQFKVSEVLENNPQEKTISFLGDINDNPAVIRLEKLGYDSDKSPEFSGVSLINSNDIYSWYISEHQKVNVICPATEKHINKYRAQKKVVINETSEIYHQIVKPYIQTMKGDRIQWVKNILFHGAEKESVVFRNDDLVLLPDMKWNLELSSLYVICIVTRDISCIRDLQKNDRDWLIGVRDTCVKQVSKKYGLAPCKLKLYVHYHPSYYHFHIHIVNSDYDGLRSGMSIGKAILVDEVIENLKYSGYEERTITVELGENHDLCPKLSELSI